MERARVIVRGRVQGVWFRQSTANEADRLGLAGWVRNNADGAVEAVFEGSPVQLAQMLAWCRVGPPLARVTGIDEVRETPEGLSTPFKVVR